MAEIKLQKRYKYAGDIMPKLLDIGFDLETASNFLNDIPDADVVPRAVAEEQSVLWRDHFNSIYETAKASLQEVITLNSKLEAENAKLQRLLDFYEETSGNKKAKSEAIKEFAWRLKNRLTPYPEAPFCEMVGSLDIDALVEEMTEENK